MTIKETIGWLKIIRADLKNFPEISNSKKIVALTNAIYIAEAVETFTDPKYWLNLGITRNISFEESEEEK